MACSVKLWNNGCVESMVSAGVFSLNATTYSRGKGLPSSVRLIVSAAFMPSPRFFLGARGTWARFRVRGSVLRSSNLIKYGSENTMSFIHDTSKYVTTTHVGEIPDTEAMLRVHLLQKCLIR